MNINNAAGSRAQFYDRAASPFTVGYSFTGIGPHAQIVRDDYTVPTGKKSIISGIIIEMVRQTVAAGLTQRQIWYRYTPNGGAATVLAVVRAYSNTAGDRAFNNVSPGFVMYAGDQLECLSLDSGVGGTIAYAAHAMITEFDV